MKTKCLLIALVLGMSAYACTTSTEETPEVKASFSSFAIMAEGNEGATMGDVTATITDGKVEARSAMVLDPTRLVATFTTDGVEVYVGDRKQESGKTINDFSKPVTYSIVSTSGHRSEWIVTISNTGIPSIFINTPKKAIVPPKTEDWLENTEVKIVLADGTVDFESSVANIRGRGNSTWGFPKKPYALKLDEKASILGMPKHKRWVLLANWLDRTSMRNHIAFHIARQTDLEWTPRGEFVELFLNGKHKGCYYLCEQIKIDENRVDISEPSDSTPSGGYLMELDVYFDEAYKFHSPIMNLPYMFKDPDEVTPTQMDYMQNYVAEMESALSDHERLLAGDYREYLDVDSFIDWWLVHELTGNSEPYHPKSSYMYKDADGLLKAGPVWDFDWETFVAYKTSEYVVKEAIYYGYLFADPAFVARIKERWEILKPRFDTVAEFIDSEAVRLAPAIKNNIVMWPIDVEVNKDEKLPYEEAVARLKNCYLSKLRWLNQKIKAM